MNECHLTPFAQLTWILQQQIHVNLCNGPDVTRFTHTKYIVSDMPGPWGLQRNWPGPVNGRQILEQAGMVSVKTVKYGPFKSGTSARNNALLLHYLLK